MQSSSLPSAARIGTRGSPLALAQANAVRDALIAAHGLSATAVTIEVIRTTGDAVQDRPLAEIGGKGLFTKEIEQALIDRRIDIAVHSTKDVPTVLPDGLILAATPPREDVRDVFISRKARSLAALPPGSVIGTASLRRQALAKRLRPDLVVVPLRGNVGTRLRKLDAGDIDATLLALAGLKRLGLKDAATSVIDAEEFLPAPGQGAVCLEVREDDAPCRRLVAPINHAETFVAITCERAFLAVLDGSCRTPIAGYAQTTGDILHFRGMILRPDGSECHETSRTGPVGDAARLGRDAGAELKARAGPRFLSAD